MTNKITSICHIGPITRDIKETYGFRISFNTPERAVYYKDMFTWIIQSDNMKVLKRYGYHDIKEKE